MCTLFVVNCDKYVTQVRYGHLCYTSDIGDSWVVVCSRGNRHTMTWGYHHGEAYDTKVFWDFLLVHCTTEGRAVTPMAPLCHICNTCHIITTHLSTTVTYMQHIHMIPFGYISNSNAALVNLMLQVSHLRGAFGNIRISLYSNVWICYTFTNLHTYRSGRLK